MDLARRQRVMANVRLIEARDEEERAQILRFNAAPAGSHNTIPGVKSPPLDEPLQTPPSSQTPQRQPDPLLQTPPISDPHAPQSWAPKTLRRGGES